jgi:hydroxyacylglutathione hydrolase
MSPLFKRTLDEPTPAEAIFKRFLEEGVVVEAVVPVVDEGLGNTTWLVDLGDGRALVVDASRDLRGVHAAVRSRSLTVAFAADTHLHADFVTGAVDLAGRGAQLLASAAGGRAYGHRGLVDGEEVDLGGLTLRTLTTPGHTDEHVAFLLLDGSRPLGVFTGGSLIVGAAARTDLVRPERTEELARAQWRSLQRLAQLPDEVAVWPTHGAGSFCSAPPGAARSSTIGQEKQGNALLRAPNETAFVEQLLGGLGACPAYFRHLGEINRRGPAPLPPTADLRALSPNEVEAAIGDGALVVDVRPVEQFASAHLPRSVSIPLRSAFATWLGWTADPSTPLVVVRDAEDLDDVVWQARKIGCDRLLGELGGGLPAWQQDGRLVRATNVVSTAALDGRPVVDVRQASEFTAGRVAGAVNAELGALAEGNLPDLPHGAVVMCGHGERAMTAASLLERAGRRDVSVAVGGPEDWARSSGQPLEVDG